MSCRGVRHLLHRDSVGLSEAERILLEEHLETCGACVRSREQLGLARELVRAMPSDPLPASVHQRALAKAMLRGSEPAVQRRAWAPFAIAGAALAFAAVLVGTFVTREQARLDHALAPVAIAPQPNAPQPNARVVEGAVMATTGSIAAGTALPENTTVQTAGQEARLVVPAAQVKLGTHTAIRWKLDGDIVFELDRGVVDIEVDPAARIGMRVVTTSFVVRVTGTVFRVTPSDVSVTHGSVQVLALDGAVLAVLGAGHRWTVEPPAPPATPSARTLLDRAVRAFAAKNCKLAEHHADAALDVGPTRREAAEARTLLAECAQSSGRLDEALRRYDAIAMRFADLPAGETAAIAAARIDVARGKRADARARFQRYLDRFPTGRFAEDARRQLQVLEQ